MPVLRLSLLLIGFVPRVLLNSGRAVRRWLFKTTPPPIGTPIQPYVMSDKAWTAFSHCQQRAKERLGMELSLLDWQQWGRWIQQRDPRVLFLWSQERGGDLWRIVPNPTSTMAFFVVFRLDHVVTILPPKPSYRWLIERALCQPGPIVTSSDPIIDAPRLMAQIKTCPNGSISLGQRRLWMFAHCRSRLHQFYGLACSEDTWLAWPDRLHTALRLGPHELGGDIYQSTLEKTSVFVVLQFGQIASVLAPSKRLWRLAKQAKISPEQVPSCADLVPDARFLRSKRAFEAVHGHPLTQSNWLALNAQIETGLALGTYAKGGQIVRLLLGDTSVFAVHHDHVVIGVLPASPHLEDLVGQATRRRRAALLARSVAYTVDQDPIVAPVSPRKPAHKKAKPKSAKVLHGLNALAQFTPPPLP